MNWFHRLLGRADVMVELPPGVAARLGIGHDDVRRANESIAYWSVSGTARTDPTPSGRGTT